MKSILCSSSMRACLILGLIALLFPSVNAHTYLSTVVLGGTQLQEGDCVRPHPSSNWNGPISSVTSADMTCGFLPSAARAANRACPIAAGSSIGIIWHRDSNSPSDSIIDSNHRGPIIFYLAKSSTGSGNVWFKVYEDGYDPATKRWAVDRLRTNKGVVTFTIPADISPGNYLLRGEVLALHQASRQGGVQPYVGCVELAISGSGTANPAGVAFPGAYKANDPSLVVTLSAVTSYTIPGPALYTSSSSTGSSTPAPSTPAPTTRPTSAPTTRPTTAPTTRPTSAPTTRPTSAPTTRPTSAPTTRPTSAPTTRPTSAPTTRPTSAPTTRPTSAPTPTPTTPATSAPTTPPTTPPTAPPTTPPTTPPATGGENSIKLELNPGTNSWWFGVAVKGGSQSTVRVEVNQNGNWIALSDQGWAYVLWLNAEIKLPLSLRLTSSSGKQLVLDNVYTSWSSLPPYVDTLKDFPLSRSIEDAVEVEDEVQCEDDKSQVVVSVFPKATPSYFAVQVSGVVDIASVELMDSAALSSYAFMTAHKWGYGLAAPEGADFVAPLSVRVTDAAGTSVTAIIESVTPNLAAVAL